ncbi:cobalamin biosynthesis protein [Clostridioides difficile]|uniref:cobalamin biosynthesis protein n=1 Tax=Clostridioides difficile TaxID=1496 RepID=UPI002566DF1A|nr:hypothetical protein JSCD9_35030 [Clostridioides difficile]
MCIRNRKKDEKAIIELSKTLKVPFKTFSIDEISKVDNLFDKSDFVKKMWACIQ